MHTLLNDTNILGLAEYSNANFLTLDTMWDYPHPNIDNDTNYLSIDWLHPETVVAENGKQYNRLYIKFKDGVGEDIAHLAAVDYYTKEYLSNIHMVVRGGFTLDEECWKDYAAKLIPRAVGYSAALLDYFFRGTIEISLPEKGVFALTDSDPTSIDPTTQGFDHITLRAQNTSPEGEEMTNGTIELVVKYKVAQEDQFQTNPPEPPDEFHYLVVELPGVYSIPGDTPEEFAFDLPDNQIPLWATDISLYLIYRGTLGSEDEAVGVGFKDICEPTPIDYFNVMDQVCLYGELYEAGSDNAIALVDANGNGVVDPDEWDVFPHDAEDIYIRFSPVDDPQDATSEYPELNTYYFPSLSPGDYVRIFLLSDYEFNRSVTVVYTPVDPRDQCAGFHGEFPRPSQTMSGVYNQTVLGARITSSFHQIRGIDSFFTVLFDNLQYPLDQPCAYW